MKITKYILLIIGILGIGAAVYGMVNGDTITDHIITLICGASLIYGFYALNKKEKDGV